MAARNSAAAIPGQPPAGRPYTGRYDVKTKEDILAKVAFDCLDDPADVRALVLTNRKLSASLDLEIYRNDVLQARGDLHLAIRQGPLGLDDQATTALLKLSLNSMGTPGNQVHNEYLRRVMGDLPSSQKQYLVHFSIPGTTQPTLLHRAAKLKNLEMAHEALLAGQQYWPGYIDAKYQDSTALMYSVLQLNPSRLLIDLLLNNGCFVDTWQPADNKLPNWYQYVHDGTRGGTNSPITWSSPAS
jgi:hypothetical protein